jgi:hypothetical protein
VWSGCGGIVALLWRLREPLTKLSKLSDLARVELRVPIGHVLHRLVKPLGLVLRGGPNHAASHDVLEQFVAGFLERSRHRLGVHCSIFLLRHVREESE